MSKTTKEILQTLPMGDKEFYAYLMAGTDVMPTLFEEDGKVKANLATDTMDFKPINDTLEDFSFEGFKKFVKEYDKEAKLKTLIEENKVWDERVIKKALDNYLEELWEIIVNFSE